MSKIYEYATKEFRTVFTTAFTQTRSSPTLTLYRVRINYRRILQNHIFTNTEQKYMMLLPFERGMFAVS